ATGRRPMCACTFERSSAIILCADFESSWVKLKEVSPCTTVAATTISTIGVRRWIWRLPMTSSTKYFVEAGRINPEMRLMPMRTRPKARIPRRGLMRAHTSGKSFQACFCLAGLGCMPALCMVSRNEHALEVRCRDRPEDYTPGQHQSFLQIALVSGVEHSAVAYRAPYAGEGGNVVGGGFPQHNQGCPPAWGKGSFLAGPAAAFGRGRGERPQDILRTQHALLERAKLVLGAVVGHVADIGAKKQLAAKRVELPDLGINGLKIGRIGRYRASEHIECGDHGRVPVDHGAEQPGAYAFGAVRHMGEYVNAAFQRNLRSSEI